MPTLMSAPGILGTCAGLAGAAWLGYNCYSPTSQVYGQTLTHCADPRHLALTYDDGPNDVHTERLLDVLALHEVKATFFLIGKFVAARPQIARAIVAAGHLMANHTESHPHLVLLSRAQIQTQLSDCSKAIADVTGIQTRFFRPPFGARRPAVLQVALELQLDPVMWSVTCFDWKRTTADAVERHARKRIEHDRSRGHIVLLHDGGHTGIGADRSHTVEATKRLIERYKNDYKFRRIDQIDGQGEGKVRAL
jgi:peptidoglycan/xylan/chitin deacetylase (PgdA/CDA1 family)